MAGHCPTCSCTPGRTWQVELPVTKPMSLNHRQHYMVQAKLKAELREAMGELVELAGVPSLEHCITRLFYAPKDNRVRDPINLVPTLKVCEDALKDCGVVVDDNPLYVSSLMPEILEKIDKRGFLWFVIEEA